MRRICTAICIFGLFTACFQSTGKFAYTGNIKPGSWLRETLPYSYNGEEDTVRLQIYFPRGYVKGKVCRTLIVLHGYMGNQRDWETNTAIESMADQYGIVLVCPYMKNTIYETQYFPETEKKWGPMPGGLFVSEKLIPYLRNTFALAVDAGYTAIMGNSTGARGAFLVACHNPQMFGAVAGFSGDYDPVSMPRNRLLTWAYGPFKDFEERWKHTDNVMELAVNLKGIPLYITHGGKDYIVPREQSLLLAIKMRQLQKKFGIIRSYSRSTNTVSMTGPTGAGHCLRLWSFLIRI